MDRASFDFEINSLLDKAESMIPAEKLPDLPFMDIAPDVHDWHMFELDLWDIGEEIRQLVVENRKKLNNTQIERILNICLNSNAKRGRHGFVMLLGKTAYAKYSERIIPLLNDEDVDGHVIYTLYKMRAPGYAELIKPFTNHNRTWIRNEAKRYIQKYS